ncbi:hypothetical protein FNF31_00896 [Cafeteria roenbergensis]|nr:hypothetical protein FNF31_00896 [Cafeteria roenbergensis]KAA0172372.1 hypothetical protein FNF28_00055 [Cafeteria roenbergensis]
MTAASVAGGVLMVGNSFSLPSIHPDYPGVLSPANFAGVVLLIFGVPMGLMGLGLTLQILSRMRPACGCWSTLGMALLGLGSIAWSVAAWFVLIRPSHTFNDDEPADALQQLFGGFCFVAFMPFGLVALAIAVRAFLTGRAGEYSSPKGGSGARRSGVDPLAGGLDRTRGADAEAALLHSYAATDHGPSAALSVSEAAREAAKSALKRPVQPVHFSHVCSGACALLLLIAVLVVATSSLTNVWNFSAHSYLPFTSPWSLINIKIGEHFVSKVYEDSVVYFSCLAVFVVAGVLGRTCAPCRSITTRRVRCLSPGTGWWNPWAHGITVGEVGAVAYFVGIFAYWVYFWAGKYDRIRTEAKLDPDPEMQVAARVLGHLSTLVMSFLLMPSSRNSLWEAAIGVPFERAVKYHRVLGAFSWLLVSLHMFVWLGKWARQGILWNNIVTIDNLAIDPYKFHWDNFTVVICETAWLIMTVSILTAIFVRRQNYEVFYYLHQYAGILFFIVAVWHAWSFWYYGAGSMILWFVDKLCRLYKGSRECRLVSIEHHGSVTRVQLDAPSFDHSAGQYVFVNIPSIDEWQWHPFTVASAPSSPFRTLLIKDMGADTWTSQLARLATLCSADARPFSPRICVDGPYGSPRDYTGKRSIVLVAGGVGITPMHSIFADLYERALAADEAKTFRGSSEAGTAGLGPIAHVRLVWVVRNAPEANIVAETLYRAHTHNPHGIFAVELYCTTHTPGASEAGGATPRAAGYDDPDIEDEAAEGAGHSGSGEPGAPTTGKFASPFRDVSSEAVAWVQSQLRPGRPKLDVVLKDVGRVDAALARAGKPTRAGERAPTMLLACGPKGLVGSASEAAFKAGADFHEEEFYF